MSYFWGKKKEETILKTPPPLHKAEANRKAKTQTQICYNQLTIIQSRGVGLLK